MRNMVIFNYTLLISELLFGKSRVGPEEGINHIFMSVTSFCGLPEETQNTRHHFHRLPYVMLSEQEVLNQRNAPLSPTICNVCSL